MTDTQRVSVYNGVNLNPFGLVLPGSARADRAFQTASHPVPGPSGSGSTASTTGASSSRNREPAAAPHQHGGQGPVQSKRKQLTFAMDATDGDDQWMQIYEMDGDDDETQLCSSAVHAPRVKGHEHEGERFQLSQLKSCLRRRTSSRPSVLTQLMSWPLTYAAQTFSKRFLSRHAAQEQVECSGLQQQPSELHLRHDEEGRRGCITLEPKDGFQEVRSSLEARGESTLDAVGHNAAADDLGLLAEEGHGGGRGGEVRPSGHREEAGSIKELEPR